jgi:exonuclease VII small subunit
MEKEDILKTISELMEEVDVLEGNQDALNKAFDHLQAAFDLIAKYAAE